MSAQLVDRVWRFSRTKGSDKLVLLAIAHHAGEGGADGSDPLVELDVPTLAGKTGLTERAVQIILRRLEALPDELNVIHGAGQHHRHLFAVLCPDPNPTNQGEISSPHDGRQGANVSPHDTGKGEICSPLAEPKGEEFSPQP